MQLASLPQVGASTTVSGASPSGSTAAPAAPSPAAGTAVQSAVTVDLSAAALAALASQTPPSASDAAQAPTPAQAPAGGVSAMVLQAQQLAGVIADGSTASNAEKGAALAGLYKLRFSDPTAASATSWFAQSTQAQRDQINNAVDKSSFFKQAVSAAIQFNADGVAAKAGPSADGSQTAYARFNQLSSDQQVLVWAGGASQFGSPQQYSAHLGLQAAGVGAARSASGSSGQGYQSGQTAAQGSIISRIA